MLFVFCNTDSKDAFWLTDDDGVPKPFGTEAEAIAEAKKYSATSLIMKPVARVTERTTHKVEILK